MSDDRFEEFIRRAARQYHEPPVVPQAEMWRVISAKRRAVQRSTRRPTWIYWGAGIAAALVIGVGIGRYSAPGDDAVPLAGDAPAIAAEAPETEAAFHLTAAAHLARVETFLTGFRADTRSGAALPVTAPDARSLLATTRVLIDSPAAKDVMLRQLLEDIELVLTQIASYAGGPAGGPDSVELDLIDESLDQHSVLFRLRTATDAAPASATIQGVL